MASSSEITLRASGLNVDPNELAVAPGGLKKGSNVIIRRNNIVEPRRGFNHYGTSFGTSSDRAKQLMEYRTRLIRHYDDILQYETSETNEDDETVFNNFSQEVSEVESGLRIKSTESNGNLYFTTNNGIKKLSSATSDLSDVNIVKAGGIKALNIDTRLGVTLGSTSGFLPTDSTVAYRVVWNKKDANKNLIPGVPSERSVIYNSLQTMLVRDLLNVLSACDSLNTTGSYFTDGNYISTLKLPLSATASEIRTNLIALAEKLDQERGSLFTSSEISSAAIASGICTVTFAASTYISRQVTTGDSIYLNGFTVAGGNGEQINGVQTVLDVTGSGGATPTITFATTATGTVSLSSENIQSGWFRAIEEPSEPNLPATHDDLVELQEYLENIIIELQSTHNTTQVAQYNGSPLSLSNVSGTGTVVTFTVASDVRNYLAAGDVIYISGNFSPVYTSVKGVQTVVNASASTTFTISNASSGAYTGNTTDTIDRVLRFTDQLQETYIDPLQVTTTANVYVDINIPAEVTTDDFYQIFRSDIKEAASTDVLSDLIPDDNLRQVYEAFPTDAEISSGLITVEDVTPDSFFQGGAFLYTNPDTGEGILQANDLPPLAADITRFKNYVFYANTSTLQRKQFNLLGVENILTDFNNSSNPSFSLVSDNGTSEYRFIKGVQQITQLVCGTDSAVTGGGYFNINTAGNQTPYYVWFDKTGSDTDPEPSGRTGIRVNISGLTTDTSIAQRVSDTLSIYVDDFEVEVSGATVTITNVEEGEATDAAIVTGLASPFAITTPTQGAGEKITKEITSITAVAGNLYVTSGTADYFTLNSPYDRQRYYFWFSVSGGTMTDPNLSGRTGVSISVTTGDSAGTVASAINTAINNLTGIYTSSVNSSTVTATSVQHGPTVAATEVVSNGGFTVSVTQEGALDVLLSNLVSPSLAVEQTAKSLINVINHDRIQEINAFYLSGIADVPGIILLEAQDLSLGDFYILANTSNTGNSFNPPIVPEVSAITNTAANPTVITSTAHGLSNGDEIIITYSNSFPLINGSHVVTVVDANTFTIPVSVVTQGTTGVYSKVSSMEPSDNEVRPNRIYYSKLQQPEAVPLVNYLDVGASDQEIVRIFPLRDSLFVFKKDGLYRISGESAPFTVTLFDSSCILVCPDSLAVSNNFLFGFTTQGVSSVSEGGVDKVSKPIDIILLKLNTSLYTNFVTSTWGVGYDSDNSYILFTVTKTSDTIATIAYYYSTLTNTWTTFDKSNTCGLVKRVDDKLYLGSGDFNRLEQERKNFTRTDYADYELSRTLDAGKYINSGGAMIISDSNEIEAGDVVYQNQLVSVYDYHKLLKKLDIDPGVAPAYTINGATWADETVIFVCDGIINTFLEVGDRVVVSGVDPIGFNGTYEIVTLLSNSFSAELVDDPGSYISSGEAKFSYFDTFELTYGANMRTALEDLTAKLDIDPGLDSTDYVSSIASYSGTAVAASAADPTVVTNNNHGLLTNRYVNITDSTTSPTIDNRYNVTKINANTFSLPVEVLTAGTLSYETLINNFNDIFACYNIIVEKLNSDTGAAFTNYQELEGSTEVECIIDAVNIFSNQITLNKTGLLFTQGPLTIFKSYKCNVEYLPITLDNYLYLKQFSEAQAFFQNKTFTNIYMKFASDLIPGFTNVEFEGFGNGVFGNEAFGENYFGGDSHSAPFRTYVPQDKQRARFLRIGMEYQNAREFFSLLGVTITGRIVSTRAYR
jgi:hypothetical protein